MPDVAAWWIAPSNRLLWYAPDTAVAAGLTRDMTEYDAAALHPCDAMLTGPLDGGCLCRVTLRGALRSDPLAAGQLVATRAETATITVDRLLPHDATVDLLLGYAAHAAAPDARPVEPSDAAWPGSLACRAVRSWPSGSDGEARARQTFATLCEAALPPVGVVQSVPVVVPMPAQDRGHGAYVVLAKEGDDE